MFDHELSLQKEELLYIIVHSYSYTVDTLPPAVYGLAKTSFCRKLVNLTAVSHREPKGWLSIAHYIILIHLRMDKRGNKGLKMSLNKKYS